MNEQDLCQKRLLDLSRQADHKGIVLFSDFLNLYEQNIYHTIKNEFATATECFGGYEGCERQMVAFIPDVLYYEWEYPICGICIRPLNLKFAEALSHRDVLGALVHLGIDRRKLGDIICREDSFLFFCDECVRSFILESLTRVRHTPVVLSMLEKTEDIDFTPDLEERWETVASNRIDAVIARAYRLSRSEALEYLVGEKVFMNGKCITNCNQSCENQSIISVRGKGRFLFETENFLNKKGKLKIKLSLYK